jgi:MFS family permease
MTGQRNRRALVGLYVAAGVSLMGSRISFVALPWLVLITTGSPLKTGVVSFAELVPYVVVNAVGGPLIDRMGARLAAVSANATSAVLVAAIPLLHHLGALEFVVLVALIAPVGALRGLADSAMRVLLPEAVAAAGVSMTRAVTVFDGVSRAAALVGAPLGGVLIAAWGTINTLWLDAFSFVVAAASVALLVRVARPAPDAEAERVPYLRALREGAVFLRTDRLLRMIAVMLLITNLFDQAYLSIFAPVWAHEVADSSVVLGLLFGASSAGAVVGNIVFTVVGTRLARYPTYTICFLVVGAPRLVAMAFSDEVWMVLPVCFAAGLDAAAINTILGTVEYERIPAEMLSRVLGMMAAISWAGIPLGSLLGGWIVPQLGLTGGLLVAGGAYLLVTLVPVFSATWRQMSAPQDERRSAADVSRSR